jgi:hypothetical protein
MTRRKKNTSFIIRLTAIIWLVSWCCTLSALAEDSVGKDAQQYPVTVPDTVQRLCYNTRTTIPCPKPGKPFYGQDAGYSINAPQYELINENQEEVIIDHTTGLSWQRLPDGVQRTWSEAIDYADALELAGFNDWRLPSKQELQSILSYGSIPTPLLPPALDSKPGRLEYSHPGAWTLTTRVFPSLTAKAMRLNDNRGIISDKYDKKYVYAVRGPILVFGTFKDNGNGTVTDSMTGLMWQADEALPANWEHALAYCEKLDLGGFKDWRLPTIKELSTLVDESNVNPSIDTAFFPATSSAPYWTSTTFNGHPGFAWYVRFDNGLEYNGGYKGRRYSIRAVRGGTIAASPAEPSILPRPQPVEEAPQVIPARPATPDLEDMDMLEPYPLDPDANYD